MRRSSKLLTTAPATGRFVWDKLGSFEAISLVEPFLRTEAASGSSYTTAPKAFG